MRARICVCVCVRYTSASAHAYCASASSCPAAYKLSAAITEEGPHCVKDKSAVCHQWEITVIYEGLSQQRQVNMHFRALSEIPQPFCILKEKDVGTARNTHLNIGCCETISTTNKPSLCFRMSGWTPESSEDECKSGVNEGANEPTIRRLCLINASYKCSANR